MASIVTRLVSHVGVFQCGLRFGCALVVSWLLRDFCVECVTDRLLGFCFVVFLFYAAAVLHQQIDIDIVAPECIIPDLPYQDKYFATMLLPIGMAIVLFASWLMNICFDKCGLCLGCVLVVSWLLHDFCVECVH